MTPDSSIGRVLTMQEAEAFFEQVVAAEKIMGPLGPEERNLILKNFGKDITTEDLIEMIQGKRILRVKGGNDEETA